LPTFLTNSSISATKS